MTVAEDFARSALELAWLERVAGEEIIAMWYVMGSPDGKAAIVPTPWSGAAEKAQYVELVAETVRRRRATAAVLVVDAWTRQMGADEDPYSGPLPSQHVDGCECLVAQVWEVKGSPRAKKLDGHCLMWLYRRDDAGQVHKVEEKETHGAGDTTNFRPVLAALLGNNP